MIHPRRSFRPLARVGLLLAAVLHLASAGAGSRTHLAELRGQLAGASEQPGQPDSEQTPTHDERGCLLCHSVAQGALPSAGAVLPRGSVILLPRLARAWRAPARLGPAAANARAPPSVEAQRGGLA